MYLPFRTASSRQSQYFLPNHGLHHLLYRFCLLLFVLLCMFYRTFESLSQLWQMCVLQMDWNCSCLLHDRHKRLKVSGNVPCSWEGIRLRQPPAASFICERQTPDPIFQTFLGMHVWKKLYVHLLGTINVCTEFHVNLFNSFLRCYRLDQHDLYWTLRSIKLHQ